MPDSHAKTWVHRVPAWACAFAIASVPIFSSNETLSIVPQFLALAAAGMVGLSLVQRVPRPHPAMVAYVGLVLFWGWTVLWDGELWESYRTLLKISVLALTAHVAFRSREDLLLLFAVFGVTGLVTLVLNWGELRHLGALGGAELLSDRDRFAGTFANANSAGMYGVTLLLSGLIVHLNTRLGLRWLLLAVGVLSGLAICYFSGSRKAMLGLALLALAVPWIGARVPGSGRVRWVRALAFTTGAVILAALAVSSLPYFDRLLLTLKEGWEADSSSRQRMEMVSKALELWLANPVFGCGFDGFSRFSGFGVYSHTTFGEVLCNGGLVGMALIGVFYSAPAFHLAALARGRGEPPEARLGASLLSFWGLFALFSCFAVMLDAREYISIYAAVCGYAQEHRTALPTWAAWRERLTRMR